MFIIIASSSISKKTIQNIINDFNEKGQSIIYALLVLIIGLYSAKFVKKAVSRFLLKYNIGKGVTNFIVYGIYITMLFAVSITCLEIIGIKTTSVVAVLGAAGFSIGLAFKEILSNLGSGMIILLFRPFNIGDYIQGSGVEGFVSEIQIFSTILKTPDNRTIVVPNLQLTSNNIINYTYQEKRRIDFSYIISYNSDVDMVKGILSRIFLDDHRILRDPEPIIGIYAIENNTVNIVARPWVKTDDYWDVYFDVMDKVKKEFDKNKVEVPFLMGIPYHGTKSDFMNTFNKK